MKKLFFMALTKLLLGINWLLKITFGKYAKIKI